MPSGSITWRATMASPSRRISRTSALLPSPLEGLGGVPSLAANGELHAMTSSDETMRVVEDGTV